MECTTLEAVTLEWLFASLTHQPIDCSPEPGDAQKHNMELRSNNRAPCLNACVQTFSCVCMNVCVEGGGGEERHQCFVYTLCVQYMCIGYLFCRGGEEVHECLHMC